MEVHHLGVATRSVEALTERYVGLFDATVAHEERFDGMTVRFLRLDGNYVELLEPDGEGPVERFLDRSGPGIHHVAVAADDIEAALERARSLGVEPIDESPRPGAWGHQVAFLHPSTTGGVLIELVEERGES